MDKVLEGMIVRLRYFHLNGNLNQEYLWLVLMRSNVPNYVQLKLNVAGKTQSYLTLVSQSAPHFGNLPSSSHGQTQRMAEMGFLCKSEKILHTKF